MKKFRMAASIIGAVLFSSVIAAFASGLWPNLPIVGNPSYCAGTSTLFGGQACTTTIPAGPSAITGAEQFPADISGSAGPPTTVLLSMRSINALPPTFVQISPTAATLQLTPGAYSGGFVIDSLGAVTPTVIVFMPASPMANQRFYIATSSTGIAQLSVSSSDGSIVKSQPTSLTPSTTAGGGYEWIYNSTNNWWSRLR